MLIDKEITFKRDFIIFTFTCIFAVTISTGFILYLPNLFKKYVFLNELANSNVALKILYLLPFLGGAIIFKIYLKSRKSIKAFNDLLLLGIGFCGLYSILFFGIDALVKNEYFFNVNSVGTFSIKLLFMMYSVAKVAITFSEFCDERKREIEDKKPTIKNLKVENSPILSKAKIGISLSVLALVFYHLIKKKN